MLDRAVEQIHIRLDELKVRRSGVPERTAEGTILHRDIRPSPRFHMCTEGRGTGGNFSGILLRINYASIRNKQTPPPPHAKTEGPGWRLSR